MPEGGVVGGDVAAKIFEKFSGSRRGEKTVYIARGKGPRSGENPHQTHIHLRQVRARLPVPSGALRGAEGGLLFPRGADERKPDPPGRGRSWHWIELRGCW